MSIQKTEIVLGVEKEDEESEGSNSLIKQESHSNKGESTVEEKPSRVEVSPARGPHIDGLQWVPSAAAPLPKKADRDRSGEDDDDCTNQHLPLHPVLILHLNQSYDYPMRAIGEERIVDIELQIWCLAPLIIEIEIEIRLLNP